jgi:hypothetical protein
MATTRTVHQHLHLGVADLGCSSAEDRDRPSHASGRCSRGKLFPNARTWQGTARRHLLGRFGQASFFTQHLPDSQQRFDQGLLLVGVTDLGFIDEHLDQVCAVLALIQSLGLHLILLVFHAGRSCVVGFRIGTAAGGFVLPQILEVLGEVLTPSAGQVQRGRDVRALHRDLQAGVVAVGQILVLTLANCLSFDLRGSVWPLCTAAALLRETDPAAAELFLALDDRLFATLRANTAGAAIPVLRFLGAAAAGTLGDDVIRADVSQVSGDDVLAVLVSSSLMSTVGSGYTFTRLQIFCAPGWRSVGFSPQPGILP